MSESQPQPSNAQSSTEEPPEFDQVALQLFRARLVTELEPDEDHLFIQICQLAIEIRDLLNEVQQTYHSQRASLAAEVHLRETIETQIDSSLGTQRFTSTFILALQENAIQLDSLSGRGGFRDFMTSRFVRTFCQDIFEHQLDAKSSLTACKIEICFRTSSNLMLDDYVAVANYMSSVYTFFNREFRKYAADILTPIPTDEDIVKLRGLVSCMCFHGVRSLGRLFAHAQYLRRKLEAFEESFQKTWLTLPIEEANRVSFPLAFVRDALHVARRHTMILIALAMRFVHDEDEFVSYCRAQEDRTARQADILYGIQDQIHKFIKILQNFTSDFSPEKMTRNSSSFPTDPIEVHLFDMRVREGYDVFLVHDGTENCFELAIHLLSEIQKRAFICYMESAERLRNDEDLMSDQTEKTLDDACVGVFLLTPEFAKRKRKVAQLQHMIGRVRNARIGWPGPTIIPVFFMVSIADCRSGNIFGEACESGDVDKDAATKASHYDTRYTGMADCHNDTIAGEASKDADVDEDAAKKAFHYVTRYTGIENHDGARVSENEEVDERCMGLVRRTADAVEEVCITTLKEYSEHMKRTGSGEENDEQKEQQKRLSDMVLTLRRSQREAREKAILNGERDPFRTV